MIQQLIRSSRASLASGIGLLAILAGSVQATSLPPLGVDPHHVTVSGLSSGAYMAAQFEVAFSSTVSGAGIIAGGPYGCSLGSTQLAATRCSCPANGDPNIGLTGVLLNQTCRPWTPAVLELLSKRQTEGNQPFIDPTEGLRQHRIWLFSGGKDKVVNVSLVDALEGYYVNKYQVPARQVRHVHRAKAGHGMPVLSGGVSCQLSQPPFLNDCQLDAAGALLKWLYPSTELQAVEPNPASLVPFDQSGYTSVFEFSGLDQTGWAYIPQRCQQASARCKLHVVFHGCDQSQQFMGSDGQVFGKTFVEQAGYNRWAEGSGIVVLYPQVLPSSSNPLDPYRYNPKGCWDFWGYTSPLPAWVLPTTAQALPFARKSAPQMSSVKAMIDDLIKAPSP